MSQLNTFKDLKDTLIRLSQRDDIVTDLDIFIQLTEADIQAQLIDVPVLIESSRFTLEPFNQRLATIGTAQIKRVTVDGYGELIARSSVPTEADTDPTKVTCDKPCEYAIEGKDIIKFWPMPTSQVNGTIEYVGFISPLLVGGTVSNTTSNWMLQNHPDVYLYGCLATVHTHMNSDEINKWSGMYDRAIGNVKTIYKTDNKMSYSLWG